MGSFGERLRREREMRGISLDEIATATKISARNLRALEEEKFNQLPGGIFNKGFVRAYAKFLGIDEEQMVAEYVTASHEVESVREQKLNSELSKAEFKRLDKEREISLEPQSQWGTIAVIVLLAVGAFGGYQYYQKKKAQRQEAASQLSSPILPIPAPQPEVQAPAAQPNSTPTTEAPSAGTTALGSNQAASPVPNSATVTKQVESNSTAPSTTKTSTPGMMPSSIQVSKQTGQNLNEKGLTQVSASPVAKPVTESSIPSPIALKIHFNQESWVSIVADGKTVVEGTLPEASDKTVRAQQQVVLTVGNAGGVEVSYNGKMLENLGKGAEVKKLTFTPSGYQ